MVPEKPLPSPLRKKLTKALSGLKESNTWTANVNDVSGRNWKVSSASASTDLVSSSTSPVIEIEQRGRKNLRSPDDVNLSRPSARESVVDSASASHPI